MPSTTRKPLPPATETLEAFHVVGSHVYMVRFRPGQEELARESIYRFSRNKELAFSWTDAAVMWEQVPYVPEEEAAECDCEACRLGSNHVLLAKLQASKLETAKGIIGVSFLVIAALTWKVMS